MQRADELAVLSREHHVALEMALRLRRATVADAQAARAAFLAFFDDEARDHFRAEEELLIPALLRHVADDDPDVVRVLREHVKIRRLTQELAEGDANLDRLHALGELLNAHVRHEERTLFPRVEGELDEEELAALGAALLDAEGGAHDPPRR